MSERTNGFAWGAGFTVVACIVAVQLGLSSSEPVGASGAPTVLRLNSKVILVHADGKNVQLFLAGESTPRIARNVEISIAEEPTPVVVVPPKPDVIPPKPDPVVPPNPVVVPQTNLCVLIVYESAKTTPQREAVYTNLRNTETVKLLGTHKVFILDDDSVNTNNKPLASLAPFQPFLESGELLIVGEGNKLLIRKPLGTDFSVGWVLAEIKKAGG